MNVSQFLFCPVLLAIWLFGTLQHHYTPLMSVTNAVSSIIIIGAITQISATDTISLVLASIAIFIASINIFGGSQLLRECWNV